MLHTMRAYETLNRTVTVVVGFDSHWAADLVSLTRMMKKFRGEAVKRFFFDEGGSWHDMFALMRGELRPGHWGVFHVARFDVGPELWRRMRVVPFEHPEFRRWKQRHLRGRPVAVGADKTFV